MTFERRPAPGWQRSVPGASWFRADLHIHTIDDHPGGRAKLPEGLSGAPDDPATQQAYARRFLQQLVASGVQVAGLTPHSPRAVAEAEAESSSVWRIVNEWNRGVDDDEVPFREKIFAVFPGFEINVNVGRKGVHLLVLFDPEIGRQRHLGLFDAVMDGATPWKRGSLQMTGRNPREILRTLDGHARASRASRSERPAEFLLLGSHFLDAHGVHGEMGSQVLDTFPLDRLAGLGLPRGKLAEDFDEKKNPGRYWLPRMRRHRQAFFGGSDAYALEDIGRRHTWIKLASPRIRALQQAFVASDSRLREGFERTPDGSLAPVADPPSAGVSGSWLRRVSVKGNAAFFGGSGERTDFRFSPDLTCVIGGSMTGKSTLLDGLRLHTDADLPQRRAIREDVVARGEKFLAGSADVAFDCPGSDPTARPGDSWPARFFAQNELQQLAQDGTAVEDILARLDGAEAARIEALRERVGTRDAALLELAASLNRIDERSGEAEQAEARARTAQEALEAFAEAGVEEYHRASRAHQNWRSAGRKAGDLSRQVDEVADAVSSFVLPRSDGAVEGALLEGSGGLPASVELHAGWLALRAQLDSLRKEARRWARETGRFADGLGALKRSERTKVERSMAARGRGGSDLRQFEALSRQAALLASYERHARELGAERDRQERRFAELGKERDELFADLRAAFDRVIAGVAARQGSRIRGRREDDADPSSLTAFLESFRQGGITRWWRGCADPRPTPARLLACLESDDLGAVGMSPAVQRTFRETMTAARRRRLAALRCRDRYVLELEVAGGKYRPLSELSGGQRVSVLLTLLLETSDDRPLVIDQPEDELDNRFLSETVLPALRNLKGRRQVIVATHDANIVVNGDADMVIQLEATAEHGRIACSGAIDDPAVRDAIVQTVDGGREAFRLRRRKYGF